METSPAHPPPLNETLQVLQLQAFEILAMQVSAIMRSCTLPWPLYRKLFPTVGHLSRDTTPAATCMRGVFRL